MIERDYGGSRAYGQSKLAQITAPSLWRELATRDTGLTVNALHPSTMMPTKMVTEEYGRTVDTLEAGVEATPDWLPTRHSLSPGSSLTACASATWTSAYDPKVQRRLWELSLDLTGAPDSGRPGRHTSTARHGTRNVRETDLWDVGRWTWPRTPSRRRCGSTSTRAGTARSPRSAPARRSRAGSSGPAGRRAPSRSRCRPTTWRSATPSTASPTATSRGAGSRRCSTTSSTSTSTGWATAAATPPRSSPSPTPWSPAATPAATSATAGWACEFQAHPRDEPSQIVLHVRMLDDDAKLQQEALGIVGVNLLHARLLRASRARRARREPARPAHHRPHRDRHDPVPAASSSAASTTG